MTVQDAIKHCKEKEDCTKCGQEHKQLRLWLEELLTLRKKQTPKKTTHPYKYCLNYQCPNCGDWEWSTHISGKWKPNYCPNCGQALDWSDEECANG